MMLGNAQYGFPWPNDERPIKEEFKRMPLAEVWSEWLVERPKKTRDKDGLEFFRATMLCSHSFHVPDGKTAAWKRVAFEKVYGKVSLPKLKHGDVVSLGKYYLRYVDMERQGLTH